MIKRTWIRCLTLAASLLAMSSTGWSYYYYCYYNAASAPYGQPIVQRFVLSNLLNDTVPFFISDTGPSVLAPGDSFTAMISQIRAAAQVWNSVGSSKLRLAYGGLYTDGASTQFTPGINIEFTDEIPPGLVAVGAPTSTGNLAFGDGNYVIPIIRSTIYLPKDLTQVATYGNFPSYSEPFFVTLVHEFGHTIGLQHTLTSGVMSTLWTSAASKASPLGIDDIAGISMLYPTDDYLTTVGSLSGRVTLNGTGLNLASVVALSPSNPAISTLTNPDGSYRMDGVPPGQYFVYVHPLPPALYGENSPDNIIYPTDINGKSMELNYTAFATQFFTGKSGGTRDISQAYSVPVFAATLTSGVDFKVSARDSQAVYAVRTYGFSSTNVPVASPPITKGVSTAVPVAASGAGLLQQNNIVTPGLSVSVLGNAASANNLRPYPPPTPYIAVDVNVSLTAGQGPKHLLFYTPNDLYVLPAAFSVVYNVPPSIASVTPAFDTNGARVVLIAGTGFFPDKNTTTSFMFDGLAGTIEGTAKDGRLIVVPPAAQGGYIATVEALNSDGQSSLFLNPAPPTFTYDRGGVPALTISPKTLVPGSDITVDIVGTNTNFVDGVTTVGFGTSDVMVKQIKVLSPTHMTAIAMPHVTVSTSVVTVTTGLEVVSQALGYKITTVSPKQ